MGIEMKDWFLRKFIFRHCLKEIDFHSGEGLRFNTDAIGQWANKELGPDRARIFRTETWLIGPAGVYFSMPHEHLYFRHKEDMMAFKLQWM